MNTQKWAVILFLVWTLGHLALRMAIKVRQARLRPRGEIHQAALFAWMVRGYLLVLVAAFLEWCLTRRAFHWEFCAIGLLFTTGSLFLQYRAFHDLGSAYSPDIEVQQDHALVRTGLYGVLRHPMLTSLLLEVWGITFFMNAHYTSFLVALLYVPVVLHRQHEEEKVLLHHFGESYQGYMQQVGGLFPKGLVW